MAYHYVFWLLQVLLRFLTLAMFIVSAKCHVRLPQTGLTAAFFFYKDIIVCA